MTHPSRARGLPGALLLLAAGTLACSGVLPGDEPAAGEIAAAPAEPKPGEAQAATPAPPPPVAAAAAPTLPDVTADLKRDLCANGPGNEGADSYYSGQVTVTGNTISGTETWHLFANPKWKARGGGDCTITWKLSGYTGTPSGCGDCDLSIKVHAEPDVNGSGCVEGLKKKEARPFDEQYDVKRLADGNAFVFFHKSGKQLGQGYHDNKGTFNYLSIHQCKWF